MKFETLLSEEIQSELEALKDVEMGSEEYKAMVDGVAKLMDRSIEIEKVRNEHLEKVRSIEDENFYKEAQINDDKKDRLIKNCIAVANLVLPIVLTVWGTKKSIEFEKEGTFTTIMGRGFVQKLLPRK